MGLEHGFFGGLTGFGTAWCWMPQRLTHRILFVTIVLVAAGLLADPGDAPALSGIFAVAILCSALRIVVGVLERREGFLQERECRQHGG